MKEEHMLDSMVELEEELLRENAQFREKKSTTWFKWVFLGVMLALFVLFSYFVATDRPGVLMPPDYNGIENSGFQIGDKQYSPMTTEVAVTEDNIGAFVGYVTVDGHKSSIEAYRYMTTVATVTDAVVIRYKGAYKVFCFTNYAPDGTEDWPKAHLKDTGSIEVTDDTTQITYITIVDEEKIGEMVSVLSGLGQKHTYMEARQWCYMLFKDSFDAGDIFIDISGTLRGKTNEITAELKAMIAGEKRKLRLRLLDGSYLQYTYFQGAGILECYNAYYFLTEDQVEILDTLLYPEGNSN